MSDMKNFDKHVRDAFSNYSPLVAADAWDNMMAERKRRKPKAFLWRLINTRNFFVLAAVLLAGTVAVWLSGDNISNNKIAAEKNNATMDKSPVNKKNNAAENLKEKDVSVITPAGDVQPVENKNETGQNKPLKENENPFSAKIQSDKKPDQNKLSIQQNIKDIDTEKSSKAFATSFDSRPKYNFFKNRKIIAVTKRGSIAINKNAFDKNTTAVNDDANSGDGTLLSQGTLLGRLRFAAEKITAGSLKDLSSSKNELKPLSCIPCPEIEKNAAGNKTYWEVYAGTDFAYRKYSDTANSVYLQKRKQTTSFQSAYSAGLRYTRVFGNGISIRSGINFSQINEKFSFIQSNLVQVNYIIDPITGDTTGSYTVRGTRYKTTYNHYRTIDVPLLVGYEMGNGKLHANINAGVIVNIYSWQKGELLDTAYQPVNITTGKGASPYLYKTNMGVGFTGAVSLYYKLTERLHLLAEPYMRYNFSPMNKDNFSLQEKFTTIGLRLGVRIDLN